MGLEEKIPDSIILTSLDKMVNWAHEAVDVAAWVRTGLLRD